MAKNKSNLSNKKDSSSLNAAQLFGFCILIGGISIIVGTVFGTSSWIPAWFAMMINFGLPVFVILFYSYSVNKDTSDTLSIEQKADSVYYMGFILTLFAMTASLIALAASDELVFNAIVINFGLALTTTILGLSIRIMWLQLSSQSLADAESILRQKIMRRSQDLQDQTEKVVGSLTALSNQLATVSEPLKQSFNSLGNLDTSAESASQSLTQIAGLADRLETSVSLLQENVDSDMVKNVEDLAKSLGATTACSRPVADIGWRPHHEHVGQTGVAIRPNLYIAAGISGAIQHLAGVNGSKVIVVINTDPEAPFFKAADYGVVGDAFEVLPKLTVAINNFKASQR